MKKNLPEYSETTNRWAESFGKCWRCVRGVGWPGSLIIHHIVRGCLRDRDNLATTIILCQECHIEEHTGGELGMAGCLALKAKHDPQHYNLEAFAKAYRPNATTDYLAELRVKVAAASERLGG
jgi:hypothetical protein